MRYQTVIAGLFSAVALLCAPGCCETANCPPASPIEGQPPMLVDAIKPAPCLYPEPASLPGCSGEVRGEFVYNLGMGTIANTSAARLAGGAANPRRFCLPGGVSIRCPNPVPQSYYDAVRAGTPAPKPERKDPASTAAAPFVQTAERWEPGIAASGYCSPSGVCVDPAQSQSSLVCPPGVDCFTLPENQAASGPELIVPVWDAPAAVTTSDTFGAVTTPAETPAPATPETPAQGTGTASPMPQIPATGSIPELSIPSEKGSDKLEVVIPPLPAQPSEPTGGLRPNAWVPTPSASSIAASAPNISGAGSLEAVPLPPPEGLETSAQSEVKLPPSL